jgi:hypothetical protein
MCRYYSTTTTNTASSVQVFYVKGRPQPAFATRSTAKAFLKIPKRDDLCIIDNLSWLSALMSQQPPSTATGVTCYIYSCCLALFMYFVISTVSTAETFLPLTT